MYFNKYLYSSNFEFINHIDWNPPAKSGKEQTGSFTTTEFLPNDSVPYGKKSLSLTLTSHGNDIYSLCFSGKGWEKKYAQYTLDFKSAGDGQESGAQLEITPAFGMTLTAPDGSVILQSVPDAGFGVSGQAAIFQFLRDPNLQFYGMGEKFLGLELSGKRTKFWNTDLWGDFERDVCLKGRGDPLYVSIPYLVVNRGNTYIGLLLDNPCPTFMSTESKVNIANQSDAESKLIPSIALGSEMGQPNLVILVGPTLAELTRKFQKLVGRTPLPPAWSLGYHQCRWGYQSVDDIRFIAAGMNRSGIPCDAVWLDIDYMRGCRIFTYDAKNFPDPKRNLAELQADGRRIVPIIDPGVKVEPGYDVYDSGKKADIFCRNPQGGEYIGLVWPGETAFPDYSLPEGREWWAKQVKKFAQTGITAAWLDMNDPSTGMSLCTEMLFNRGRDAHETYHNQYALGMARASREGFQAARPEERVFLLSRSGCTGSGKFTAIWTGDNASNYHWLRGSIATTLNLALSGIPFNGADVGGFADSTSPQLLMDWMKAAFLFPFMRNHNVSNAGSRPQEPWAFDETVLRICRRYIQLRYTLRPYLYNLFVKQADDGEAIMRPLFYDFSDTPALPLGKIDDEFMVGPWILQAPFIDEDRTEREVVLPTADWYDTQSGQWTVGGIKTTVKKDLETTPLYIRSGALLPLARNEGADFSFKSAEVDFALFLRGDGEAETTYAFDDGISFAYQQGKRSVLQVTAAVQNGILNLAANLQKRGFGAADAAVIFTTEYKQVIVNGKAVTPTCQERDFAGCTTRFFRVKL